MPKYPYALYYDDKGEQQKLWPKELHDTARRAFARETELWSPDQEFRLFPRYRADSPHFYALSGDARSFSRDKETDPAHKQRVEYLHDVLSSGAGFRIGFYKWDGGEQQFVYFTRTRNYSWGTEVTRALTAEVKCRHDLFGALNDLNLTARFPWVGIEVVKHHYPSDATFQAFLIITRELPCVILFDFVERWNYFLQVNETARKIRVIYYIYEGAVWRNNECLGSCSATYFQELVEENIRQLKEKDKDKDKR